MGLLLSLPSQKRRVRLRARTPPFHGGDTGSNPVRGTKALGSAGGFLHLGAMQACPVKGMNARQRNTFVAY
jgi:hypothetical protein